MNVDSNLGAGGPERERAGGFVRGRAIGPGRALAALVAVLAIGGPDPARPAQDPSAAESAPAARSAAPPDSAAILEEAREAQARFERIRIAHLPWAWSTARGPCDERIGRFCYWHDEGHDDWEPPPEPDPVRQAREDLLEMLERAASGLPGDAWIAGQRVRYLVEAGRLAEARAAARSSRAEPGWIASLEGYALHAAGAFGEAEAAFDRALAAFDEATRRRWEDASLLLDARTRRVLEDLGPGARSALERRMWWLADPLWSVPGNERRSEHFARLVFDGMQEDARSAWDVKWGHDLREILIRYGASVGWERVRPRAGALGGGIGTAVVGHEAPGGRRFVPAWEVLGGPTVAARVAWSVEVERPRSTYAPPCARRFVDLEGQVAGFSRGDRVAVVATWALEPDSLDAGEAVEASLVVAEGPDGPPALVRARSPGPAGSLVLEVPSRPAVASVEALAPGARVAGRARLPLPLPGRVSDLLVVDPGSRAASLPASLEEAARRAVPVPRAAPGGRLGVYAELYPPQGAAEARLEVRIREAEGVGFWSAVGDALGLGDERKTAALAWIEPLDDAVRWAIPFAVRWPDLEEGVYAIELEVAWPDGRRSVVTRTVRSEP